MKAIKDRIIVQAYREPLSGIIEIPDNFEDRNVVSKATVVSVGPDCPYRDDIKTGDTILVRDLVGARVRYEGERYRVYLPEDCLAVLNIISTPPCMKEQSDEVTDCDKQKARLPR